MTDPSEAFYNELRRWFPNLPAQDVTDVEIVLRVGHAVEINVRQVGLAVIDGDAVPADRVTLWELTRRD